MDPYSRSDSPLPPLFEGFELPGKSGSSPFEPLGLDQNPLDDDAPLPPSPPPEPIDIRSLGDQLFAEESGIPEEPTNAEQKLDRASTHTLLATLSYLLTLDPAQKNSYAFTRACDRLKEKIALELESDSENAHINLSKVPLKTLIESISLFTVDTHTFRELAAAISHTLNSTPSLLTILFGHTPEYFITLIELSAYLDTNLLSRLFTLFLTRAQTISSDHFKRAVTALSKEHSPALIQSLKMAFIMCAPNILPTLSPESFMSLLELFSKIAKKNRVLYTIFSNELHRLDPADNRSKFQRLGITKALDVAQILLKLNPQASSEAFEKITSCYLVDQTSGELEIDALDGDTLTLLLKYIYQPRDAIAVICSQETSDAILEELTASSINRPRKIEATDPALLLQLLHLLTEKKGKHIDYLFSSFEEAHCSEETLREFCGEELITLSKALFTRGNTNKKLFLTIQKLLLTRDSNGRRAWKELESRTQYETLSIFGRVGATNPELLQYTNNPTREETNTCSYHAQLALFALQCTNQQQLIDKTSNSLLDLLNKGQKLPDTLLVPLYIKYVESNYPLREDLRTVLQNHIIHGTSTLSAPILADVLTKGVGTPSFFDVIYRELTTQAPNGTTKLQELSIETLSATIESVLSRPAYHKAEVATLFARELCRIDTTQRPRLSKASGTLFATLINCFLPYKEELPQLFALFSQELNQEEGAKTKFKNMTSRDAFTAMQGLEGDKKDQLTIFKNAFLKNGLNDTYDLIKFPPALLADLVLYITKHDIQDAPLFQAMYNTLMYAMSPSQFEKLERTQAIEVFTILTKKIKDNQTIIAHFEKSFLKDTNTGHYALQNFTALQLRQILKSYYQNKIKNQDLLAAIQREFVRTTPENNSCKLDAISFEQQAYMVYMLRKQGALTARFFNKIAQSLTAENGKLEALQPKIVAYVAIGAAYYCKDNDLMLRLEAKILGSEYWEMQPLLIEMFSAYTDPDALEINKNNYTAVLVDYFKENIILNECPPKLLAKAIMGFLQAPLPPAAAFLTHLRITFMKGAGRAYSHFHALDIDEALLLATKMAKHGIFTKSVYEHFFKAISLRDENNHTKLSQASYKSLSEFMSFILKGQHLPQPHYWQCAQAFVSCFQEAFLRVDENGKTTLEKSPGMSSLLDIIPLFVRYKAAAPNSPVWDAITRAILPYKTEGLDSLLKRDVISPININLIFYKLIDQGLPVNHPLANKDTPLILAVKARNLAGCEKLLQRGAHVHKRGSKGLSALDHACMNGSTEIARLLITQYHAPIDSFIKSPFQKALRANTWKQNAEHMKAFFEAFFGDFPEIIAYITADGGRKSLIKYLKDNPEIVVNRSIHDPDCNPLEIAYLLQDDFVAYNMIEKIITLMGKTQLKRYLQAITQKYFEPYTTLVPQLFCYACDIKDLPFALELLTAYPKAIQLTDANRNGYLHFMATAYTDKEEVLRFKPDTLYPIAKKLLEMNIDKNSVNADGNTALHELCWHGIPKTTQLLLSHGADIARVNKDKQTAFEHALDSELCEKQPEHLIQFFGTFFGNQPEIMRLIKEHKSACTMDHFWEIDPKKLVANKAANPLMVPFLFQDSYLAEILIPHLSLREFERYLKEIQSTYPRLSTNLLTDARYLLNQNTMKASEIEANIPPKALGVTLKELLPLFDKINFTEAAAENYYDPQPLFTELGVTSIAALRTAFENDFIKKIEEKREFQGTPKKGTPALDTFYNAIESALTHILIACKKMDNSFDNKKKKSDAIIEFLKTNGKCGARIYNVSRNQYSVIVRNKALTLENSLTTNLGEFRSILLESLVPSRISEDNKTIYDIHDSQLLLKLFGKKFNIPHAAMFESFDDEYGTRKLDEEKIETQFFELYTPTAIIAELSQQFRYDEEFRNLAIDWWKKHVPASWKQQETEELIEKAEAIVEDEEGDIDGDLKQFAKKNFLNVRGKVTLEAVKLAIEEDRRQEYLGEVIDMAAVPMQIKREALIEMLVMLEVIEAQKFLDDGAGGSK